MDVSKQLIYIWKPSLSQVILLPWKHLLIMAFFKALNEEDRSYIYFKKNYHKLLIIIRIK